MQAILIMSITPVILIALLSGCATHRVDITQDVVGKSDSVNDRTPADPRLDHIFAWIPRDRAQTASVAEALVHIELGRAKDEIGRTLCGGDWLITGVSVDNIGPYPSTAPARAPPRPKTSMTRSRVGSGPPDRTARRSVTPGCQAPAPSRAVTPSP